MNKTTKNLFLAIDRMLQKGWSISNFLLQSDWLRTEFYRRLGLQTPWYEIMVRRSSVYLYSDSEQRLQSDANEPDRIRIAHFRDSFTRNPHRRPTIKMARLDAAARALLTEANGQVYSETLMPGIVRNLEGLADFIRQTPTQRENRVLLAALQRKEKTERNFAETGRKDGADIHNAAKMCLVAQTHA